MTVTFPTMLGIVAILALIAIGCALVALLIAREEDKTWSQAVRSGSAVLLTALTGGVAVVTFAFNLVG